LKQILKVNLFSADVLNFKCLFYSQRKLRRRDCTCYNWGQ